ncbi:MdtA/MuxA family multidrug efflux RND transporter periplasmic adaptor subunit [Pseudomonas fluvialis]|uniref:MdtA/MuxA family multidrug efflux RND transporter periplasmic adaptor subunit n=1 Tax=Pseudomonas fluvialis TaxID=1793966 RepID=UPI0035AFF8BB
MPASSAFPLSIVRRYWPWLVLLILLGGAFFWWQGKGSGAPAGGPGMGPGMGRGAWGGVTPVRVATVSQGDFAVYLKALGTVSALNTVSVRSRVAGELVELGFSEGQTVQQGQLLARIDPRPYAVAVQQAEGALAQTQAQLRNAEQELRRYQQLAEDDSIARQTLDSQRALVEQYRGQLKSSQASLAEARLNLQFTRISAPLSGRAGLRQVDVGNLVAANDSSPLLTITQAQPIAVQFTLAESLLPQLIEAVRAGQRLPVEAWDRSEQQRLASGELLSMDNQIDATTGTLRFKAQFANQDEHLLPNQFVNVRVLARTLKDSLLLPVAAVQFGNQGNFVFVVKDQQVSLRAVEVGPSDERHSVILSGLSVGEQVVLEGTDRLKDGARVEVVEGLSKPASEAAPGPRPGQGEGAGRGPRG